MGYTINTTTGEVKTDIPTASTGGYDDKPRFALICEMNGFPPDQCNKETIKDIIKRAFNHHNFIAEELFGVTRKPQASVLCKALKVLKTYLSTKSLLEMIHWANKDD